MHFEAIRVPFPGRTLVVAHDAGGRRADVAAELPLRRRPRRQRKYAIVQAVIPELVERGVARLLRIEGLAPVAAEVFIEVRRTSEPREQAVLRGARVEQRRDRGLREAEERRDGLGVAPCLEEMMIRGDGVRLRRRLVESI